MRETFGTYNGMNNTPISTSHINYASCELGPKGINFLNSVSQVRGIYSLITPISTPKVSGHIDAFSYQFNETCLFGCNLQLPVDYIDIWILN